MGNKVMEGEVYAWGEVYAPARDHGGGPRGRGRGGRGASGVAVAVEEEKLTGGPGRRRVH